jgi:hypothetical protein
MPRISAHAAAPGTTGIRPVFTLTLLLNMHTGRPEKASGGPISLAPDLR